MVHPTGFEPMTSGLGNRRPKAITPSNTTISSNSKPPLTRQLTVDPSDCHNDAAPEAAPEAPPAGPEIDPGLAEVMAAWPMLPKAGRDMIAYVIGLHVPKAKPEGKP